MRALEQEATLEALADDEVLALARDDRRVLVTHNLSDFPPILRDWAEAGRSHSGVILVHGIDHGEFELVARVVERWLQPRPAQEQWLDLPAVVDRGLAVLCHVGFRRPELARYESAARVSRRLCRAESGLLSGRPDND